MATEKVLLRDNVCVQQTRFSFARADQAVRRGYKQDLNIENKNGSVKPAGLKAQFVLTWFSTGIHCPGTVLRKKARRKGFRGCIQTVLDGPLK